MSLYSLALFLHLAGVAGVFAGFGTYFFVLTALRQARQVEQVRALAGLAALADPLTVGSIVALAAGGLYMGLTEWGPSSPWLDVATAGFLMIAPIGPLVVEPRMKRIVTLGNTAASGTLSAALVKQVRDPILGAALYTDVSLLLGIVFLMTNKPVLVESLITLAVAVALGTGSAPVLWWMNRHLGRSMATGIPGGA